jgi:hypothetical protein
MNATDATSHDCECSCGFIGKIPLTETTGGIFFENENRTHVLGLCPKCNATLISFHYTKK